MSKMAEEYKNSEVTWVAWQKGGHCAALSQNGKWYRARITNMIHKNVIEVRLTNLTLNVSIATKVLCFSRLLKCL